MFKAVAGSAELLEGYVLAYSVRCRQRVLPAAEGFEKEASGLAGAGEAFCFPGGDGHCGSCHDDLLPVLIDGESLCAAGIKDAAGAGGIKIVMAILPGGAGGRSALWQLGFLFSRGHEQWGCGRLSGRASCLLFYGNRLRPVVWIFVLEPALLA